MNDNVNEKFRENRRAARDLMIILIVAVFVFTVASTIDVFERFAEWSRKNEGMQIDELIVMFVLLAFAFGIFSLLRWKELKKEITERKRVEEELWRSKEWLSTTLRSIGDAVIATDTKGHITFMNPVSQILTGWEQEEAVGKPLREIFNIINEKTGEQLEDPVAKVIREGSVVGLANHSALLAKDGTVIPIDDSGAPIKDENGNLIGVVLIFRDITLRRRSEEERERLILELQEALAKIKRLKGLLPICAYCKKIRDDQGYWNQIEAYIAEHSEADFSHSICPECAEKLYPGVCTSNK